MSSMRETHRDWAGVAHRLAERLRPMLDDPSSVLVVDVAETDHYVQWHGEDGRALYGEASSGVYADAPMPEAEARKLVALGWERPYEGWGGDDVANFSRLFTAPVSLYVVVALTCRMLSEVYSARPEDVIF